MIWFESGIGIRKELHYLDEPCFLVCVFLLCDTGEIWVCKIKRQIYIYMSFDAVAIEREDKEEHDSRLLCHLSRFVKEEFYIFFLLKFYIFLYFFWVN